MRESGTGAASYARPRDREPHLPGRSIGDEPHRVDRLARRPGGDEHALALQRLRHERGLDGVDQRRFRSQTPLSFVSTREKSFFGIDQAHAELAQPRQIRLHHGIAEHVHVHRRRHDDRRARRQRDRSQQIVGEPVRELGNDVGRGRSDYQYIGRVGQPDVADF